VLKVTTPDAIEHTLEDPEAIVIATVRDELAVAVGVYVPDLTGEVGEVEVLVMVWATGQVFVFPVKPALFNMVCVREVPQYM
jgi:hypothetical protein